MNETKRMTASYYVLIICGMNEKKIFGSEIIILILQSIWRGDQNVPALISNIRNAV